jgi:hypothetical protein
MSIQFLHLNDRRNGSVTGGGRLKRFELVCHYMSATERKERIQMSNLAISKLEDSAAGRALQAATHAPLSNFVDFTSTLVANVFDTLVDNSIKQTRAYADLVASVAGTVTDFETKTLGGTIDEAALKYLADVVLPTYGGTASPALTTATPTGSTTFTNLEVAQAYAGVTALVGSTPPPVERVFSDPAVFVVGTGTNPIGTIASVDLVAFTKALLRKQVRRTYDDLRALVALGVQYIVIDNGTLKTSLTFHTDSVDSSSSDTTNTRTDYSTRARNFGGYIARRGNTSFGGKIGGFFLGRSVSNSFGGSYSDNSYSSTLNVNLVNEKTSAVTNLSIDISGSLELHFRTNSFPAVTNG